MGARLIRFYEQARAKGGVPAMVRLAAKTRVPSVLAPTHPDSEQVVKVFLAAMKELGL